MFEAANEVHSGADDNLLCEIAVYMAEERIFFAFGSCHRDISRYW